MRERERQGEREGGREGGRERCVCVCVCVCVRERERVCDKLPYPSFLAAVVVRLRRHDYQLFLNLATLDSASWQLCDDKLHHHSLT